ncbi:MAG: hypothetical protein NC419_09990 [Muribaculaceae bacterium]|nr:hypothetical protein [Muribaculaceae bacterium]
MWFSILLAAFMLTGCGKAQSRLEDDAPSQEETEPEGDAREEDAPEADSPEDTQPDGKEAESGQPDVLPELSEEEITALQYVEKTEVEDYYGDGAHYDIYAPKGSSNEDGFVSYFEHGLLYSGSACNFGSAQVLYDYLEDSIGYTVEDWRVEGSGYTDVRVSKVLDNGEDKFQIAKAKREDVYGTPYEVSQIYYLDMQGEGAGVLWGLEVEETTADEETERIIDELGACYRVKLDEIKAGGEWLAADKERATNQQDIYEPEEGETVLEAVDGYQYMGVVTLTTGDGAASCPVMAPRGWSVSIRDNHVSSSMHGISITGSLERISQQRFMWNVESDIESWYGIYTEDTENYRNVKKSDMKPISGYDEALYAALEYEELDYTEEYQPCIRVRCYIRVNDDYMLVYAIRLLPNDYDKSTNTVIKELETAYGMDLAKYYYEENE